MKLHPIPSEGHFYCGPATIAAFTGLHPKSEVRHAVNMVRSRPSNRGIVRMFDTEISAALSFLGIKSDVLKVDGGPALKDYVTAHPEFVGVLFVTGHFVAVSKGLCLDNKSRIPRPVAVFPGNRKRVKSAVRIHGGQ